MNRSFFSKPIAAARIARFHKKKFGGYICVAWTQALEDVFAEPVQIDSADKFCEVLRSLVKAIRKYTGLRAAAARWEVVFWAIEYAPAPTPWNSPFSWYLIAQRSPRGLRQYANAAYKEGSSQ